jgi:NAD(P)-dependent dehydrogenase (short-subunit alcohol dehydrogenase family)
MYLGSTITWGRGDAAVRGQGCAGHRWCDVSDRESVNAAVAFLASDDASCITGEVLPVDGGITAVHSGFVYDLHEDR